MGGVWRGAAERDRAGDAASDAPASGSRAFRVCTGGALSFVEGERIEWGSCCALQSDAFTFLLLPPPFHGHETLLALWSTYLARGLDPCDTGVLLSDYFDENDDRSGSVPA